MTGKWFVCPIWISFTGVKSSVILQSTKIPWKFLNTWMDFLLVCISTMESGIYLHNVRIYWPQWYIPDEIDSPSSSIFYREDEEKVQSQNKISFADYFWNTWKELGYQLPQNETRYGFLNSTFITTGVTCLNCSVRNTDFLWRIQRLRLFSMEYVTWGLFENWIPFLLQYLNFVEIIFILPEWKQMGISETISWFHIAERSERSCYETESI